jgi:hypothetical protein
MSGTETAALARMDRYFDHWRETKQNRVMLLDDVLSCIEYVDACKRSKAALILIELIMKNGLHPSGGWKSGEKKLVLGELKELAHDA